MPRKQHADSSLFILNTEERMIKYGLYPEEFERAIQMDKDYTLEELRSFCRAEGLSVGGEKKRLIANLIIARRNISGKSKEPGMGSEAGGESGNTGAISERTKMGNYGIEFKKADDFPV